MARQASVLVRRAAGAERVTIELSFGSIDVESGARRLRPSGARRVGRRASDSGGSRAQLTNRAPFASQKVPNQALNYVFKRASQTLT